VIWGEFMDLKKYMVIIDNDIKTYDISYIKYNKEYQTFLIKYKNNNNFFSYSKSRIKVLQNPILLNIEEYNFYLNKKIINDIKEIYEFKSNNNFYYYVIFTNGLFNSFSDNQLIKKPKNDNYIKYLKEISMITSICTNDGTKLLCKQMDKIKIDDLDYALSNYLKISNDLSKKTNIKTLIFPFGCNSSQYDAVENAIYNKVSIIEGPPGTGKTQTILNIIANIIIRNMNTQVVSNNNTAIINVVDKLKKYDLDFFSALLGKNENKISFIEKQSTLIPTLNEYENVNIDTISNLLEKYNSTVKLLYNTKKELAKLIQEKNELTLEYEYFKKLIINQDIKLLSLTKYNKNKIKLLWNELISIKNISLFNKIKYVFFYKIGNFKFYNNNINTIIKTLQNITYINDINTLDNKIKEKELYIDNNKNIEENFIKLSMDYLKKYLLLKYKNGRKIYTKEEIWKNPYRFIKDYPVILSTTYSSRNTFNDNFKFDYVIMDEASQIDIVTGTLALSNAKYAVVIGDEKQLPNVVREDISIKTKQIFNKYNLDEPYSYESNSFLSSIKKAIPNVKTKMLVEHYRCHPKIINFCNKKFYDNNLVIMTKDNNEDNVINIIKTTKGSFARDLSNQRQVDIIKEILSTLKTKDIGVIAPYNNQVNLIKSEIPNIEVNTIHKFQGREKDTIIISTVDNDISDFVGNSNILNVAISRAKNHLYFIVTGNEINNSNINDFINYVEYYNMDIINSKIYSCFDLLYKQYEIERLNFYKKHNKVLKYDSENIMYYLIKEIISDYKDLEFHVHQSLNDLIKDKSLLTEEERKYTSNSWTHIDFYIFKKIGQRPVLAIEVDGYRYHKKGTRQYDRDRLKDIVLKKYDIPLLRLSTTGSEEEKKIRAALDDTLKK